MQGRPQGPPDIRFLLARARRNARGPRGWAHAARWLCALMLLCCAWPWPQSPRALRPLPEEAPQAGMGAPPFALEPASRAGAPSQVGGAAWLPLAATGAGSGRAWQRAPLPPAAPSLLQRPSLVALQQLKLEGG
ncbi:hypothetical protein [Truepera radiovictrix]|uniref:hypothetical protein n=1 Tax=Truepera radiovictrix TaxID=332249 RepID=UPI00161DAE77|nr:hypothetical protein [Truepera radiovictrix]